MGYNVKKMGYNDVKKILLTNRMTVTANSCTVVYVVVFIFDEYGSRVST